MQQRCTWFAFSGLISVWMVSCSPMSGAKPVSGTGGTGGGTARSGTGGSGGANDDAGAREKSRGGNGGSILTSMELERDSGATAADDCSEQAKVIYLATQGNELYSFDPRIAGLSAYQRIGTLSCETESTPQSMSVDRMGKAYVFYSSGHLYYVDTTNAQCTPTDYRHPITPAKSFNQLGMGFTADATGSSKQVLYINSPEFGLATVDLRTLAVNKLNVLQSTAAELTGGPDALLFMYESSSSELSQIDRSTYGKQLVHRFNLDGAGAFAFARYAGVFYLFTASSGLSTVTSTFDPQTNTESVRDSAIGVIVVGAGQSTCVPPPPIL